MNLPTETILAIAKVCHEANRAYCETLGDNSQPAWDSAPQWQRESAVAGVTKRMENPGAFVRESHEAWMAHKAAQGWVHGSTKDEKAKTHPCMLPFEQLPVEQQRKDALFCGICRALFPKE